MVSGVTISKKYDSKLDENSCFTVTCFQATNCLIFLCVDLLQSQHKHEHRYTWHHSSKSGILYYARDACCYCSWRWQISEYLFQNECLIWSRVYLKIMSVSCTDVILHWYVSVSCAKWSNNKTTTLKICVKTITNL